MNLKKILHHAFFGFIAYFAFGFSYMSVVFPAEESYFSGLTDLPPVVIFIAGMAVFLLACGKIITYGQPAMPKGEFLKPAACFFGILLVASALFYLMQDLVIYSDISTEGGTDPGQQRADATTNLLVLFMGAFFLWMLFLKNLISDGRRDWLQLLITFLKTDVSVYLLFRAIVFLISLAGALVMGPQSGDIQNSYFLFALDDAQVQSLATGSLTGGASFFSGVTEAASFFVLTTMAEEMLSCKIRHSLADRLRRMFLEVDTFKLMLMTFACIIVGILSAGEQTGLLATLASSALIILWLISGVLFLADTKILPYAIVFTSLGFIERLLPIPELTGFLTVIFPLIVGARIILFSGVSILIANYQINREKAASSVAQVTKTGRPTFSYILWNATFMDAIIFILRLGEHGLRVFFKNAPASSEEEDLIWLVSLAKQADAYITRFITKITQSLDAAK